MIIEKQTYQAPIGENKAIEGFQYNELKVTDLTADMVYFTIKHPLKRLSCTRERFKEEFQGWWMVMPRSVMPIGYPL